MSKCYCGFERTEQNKEAHRACVWIPEEVTANIYKMQDRITELESKVTELSNEAFCYAEQLEQAEAENKRLKEELIGLAAIAHHGLLLGYKDNHECMNALRAGTLKHWDKTECSRLRALQGGER